MRPGTSWNGRWWRCRSWSTRWPALDADAARLAALAADADGWREAEARLRSVEAVVAARAALATVPVVVDPPLPDEEGYERARAAAESARGEVSAVQARLESARAERDRARVAVERSGRAHR